MANEVLIGGGSQSLSFMPSDIPSEYSMQSGLGVPTRGVASQCVRHQLKKAFKLSDSQMEHLVDMQRPFFSRLGSSRSFKPLPQIQRVVNADVV